MEHRHGKVPVTKNFYHREQYEPDDKIMFHTATVYSKLVKKSNKIISMIAIVSLILAKTWHLSSVQSALCRP